MYSIGNYRTWSALEYYYTVDRFNVFHIQNLICNFIM